jgi:translation initiation factor IF-1
MVKNFGGNKAKGYARKNQVKGTHALRASEDPAEIYAQAVKIMGGAICRVIDLKGQEMNCHIRGKFRGRGKRDNTIVAGTWLLVGLREWEQVANEGKLINCDLIEVYSDSDKSKLKNSITDVDWSPFITNDTKTIGSSVMEDNVGNNIEFADDKMQDYKDLIEAHLAQNNGNKSTIIADCEEEINIDDI